VLKSTAGARESKAKQKRRRMTSPTEFEGEEFVGSLRRMGLGESGFTLTRLSGGVSCDVWKVERPGAPPLVVKHALAKLRVAADWRAPPARAKAEVDCSDWWKPSCRSKCRMWWRTISPMTASP